MKKFIYTLSFVLLALCSYASKAVAANKTVAVLSDSSNYRFKVSFISIGSGIDVAAKKQYDVFIKAFNKKNNVNIVPVVAKWGREGETDYCLPLNKLSKRQSAAFIAKTKELLKKSTRVRYYENCPCRK